MMKVWLAGSSRWSHISGRRVLLTETSPSSGPGMRREKNGRKLRVPAMTPTSASTGASRPGRPRGPVTSWEAVGPKMQ